jgi:hypothetical protein
MKPCWATALVQVVRVLNSDRLPFRLYNAHENQLALEAAIAELSNRGEPRGPQMSRSDRAIGQ